jgi:YHS domain-containing protein
MAFDPVCGAEIDEERARQSSGVTLHGASEIDPAQGTRTFHEGRWYYFCGLECRSKFLANPDQYVETAAG